MPPKIKGILSFAFEIYSQAEYFLEERLKILSFFMDSVQNLQKAAGSTRNTKRIGRGQGSGWGKTATKGGKGQTARKGYNEKRGFEGGQQPLQRRLPKVGFTSKFEKPYAISVDRKLIGAGAKDLASKIKDENIKATGNS